MKSDRLTKREMEIDKALSGLSRNDQILVDKVFRCEAILSLILEHDKKLNKFVTNSINKKVKEVARNRRDNKK